MAPGVEVPGISVLGQALRRNLSLTDFISSAAVIADVQTEPFDQGTQHVLEQVRGHRAARHGLEVNARASRLRLDALLLQQVRNSPLQALQFAFKQTRLHVAQQLPSRQQRL